MMKVPYDLLLLADPSIDRIYDYTNKGSCYAAYVNNNVVGVYVITRTGPLTLELANVAVSKALSGQRHR